MSRLSLCLCFLLFVLTAPSVPAQDANADRLTRAVRSWQEGKATEAYLSLDSITGQAFTPENAVVKIRAAIWTATYLQEQRKYKPAAPFLDSAATWARQTGMPEEMKRAYEANARYFLGIHQANKAASWQLLLQQLKDSLEKASHQESIDSLVALNALVSKAAADSIAQAQAKTEAIRQDLRSARMLSWMFGILSAVLFTVLLLRKNKPQASAKTVARSEPAPTNTPAPSGNKIVSTQKVEELKGKEATKDHLSLSARISTVELVLIQAETLAWKMQGDGKATHKILQRYVDEFNALTKALDDAIATNKALPIIEALDQLQPFLDAFGMSGTLKMMDELKAEGKDAKVNKMLSRVFQVRNHARRALDEAKAILEKVSL